MKKTIAILLLAAMMMQACGRDEFYSNTTDTDTTQTPDTVQDETESESDKETVEAKHPETSVSSYGFDLDNLQLDALPGISNSALRHTADITSFKTGEEVGNLSCSPIICIEGEYTYVMRLYPEELENADQYWDYIDEKKFISEIEVYKNHDYSAPYETVPLALPDDISFRCCTLTYDPEDEKFYMTVSKKLAGDEKSSLNLFVFTRSGEFEFSKKIGENTLDDVRVHNGDIYYLKSSDRLARIDIETDEDTTVAEEVQQYFTSDGVLYYITAELNAAYQTEIWLYSYDDEADQSTKVMKIETDERFETANYDAATNTIFFSNFDSLCSYRDRTVKTLVITNESTVNVEHIDGGQVVILVGHNQLAVYQIPEVITALEDQQIALRVCKFGESSVLGYKVGGLDENVIDKMNATGISVRDEITYITDNMDEYVNTMAKKLMAGDTDFDFFYISSEMLPLFQKEYVADLGKYDSLNKYMDELLPGLKELCTIDGKLALVPESFYPEYMMYNKAALEEGDDVPELYEKLWTDTPKLKDGWYLMTASRESAILMKWFNQLAANYMAKTISEDTAKQDLEMLYTDAAKMIEYESVYIGSDYRKQSFCLGEEFGDGDPYSSDEPDPNIVFIPTIKLGEEYKNAVYGSFIAVNPASPNKELAAAYLVYYMNNMTTNTIPNHKYYFEGKYDPEDKYTIRQERYDILKEIFSDSIRAISYRGVGDYAVSIRENCANIQDGKLTAEQAAEQTLRYLKMMRDE